MHAALSITLRHFLVENTPTRGHPLHIAGGHFAPVAQAVSMLDGAGEDVGDRLDSAVRMPWKSLQVVCRILIAEVVQQQERIEVLGLAEAKGAL